MRMDRFRTVISVIAMVLAGVIYVLDNPRKQ